MSERVGPIAYSKPDEEVFLGRDISRRRTHSEKMAQIIDDEIKRILDESAEKAMKILNDNIELLHSTSKVLIERETIEGEELTMLVNGETLPPISKTKLEALKATKIDRIIKDESEDNDSENDNDDDDNNDAPEKIITDIEIK
jgi:cell division protease FtsH